MKMINIVFITDDNYVLTTKIAIKSLIANKKKDTQYNINIICVDLLDNNIAILNNLNEKNAVINIIKETNKYTNVGFFHKHVSKAALFKFQIPNIFSDLDKILYLDGDMLIKHDLTELYNIDLENNYAAVVKDYAGQRIEKHHLKINHKDYFNSGTMLLNLIKMRNDNMPAKLLDIKKHETFYHFMDQDALNIGFEEKVIYLSPKYNLMLANLNYDKNDIANFYNLKINELEQIIKDPIIIHLTNKIKPWNDISAVKSDEFWKYADNIDLINFILKNNINKKEDQLLEKKNRSCSDNRIKLPKLIGNLICCFIIGKSNRKHFREKYLNNSKKYNLFNTKIAKVNSNIRNFNSITQIEISYIHECYWANIFRDTIQNSEWLLNKSFSPGRAALSYVSLYILYRILNDIKPSNILECGLGQSSRMTIQYTDFYKKNLIIFEDNKDWLNFFNLQFPTAKQYTKIYELDYINIDSIEKSRVYKGYENDIKNKTFDFIIVDGPIGSKRFSRAQLLDFLNYIDPKNFIILLDDYNRIGEQDTIEEAKKILKLKNIEFFAESYSSDKSIAILCSPNYKFLLTL